MELNHRIFFSVTEHRFARRHYGHTAGLQSMGIVPVEFATVGEVERSGDNRDPLVLRMNMGLNAVACRQFQPKGERFFGA